MLVEDGRVKLSEMAEEVGLSPSGLRRWVKALEEDGAIDGYTAKVDPERVGYGVAAFLDIDVRSGESGRVAGALTRLRHTLLTLCHKLRGTVGGAS